MSVKVVDLRCDYLKNPLGIDNPAPGLSWRLESARRGAAQTAYQYRVAVDNGDRPDFNTPLFDSGKKFSSQSAHVEYSGPALHSSQRYFWQARIWDIDGVASDWSEPAWWETGKLEVSDWMAQWIEPQPDVGGHSLLRKEFTLRAPVRSARLYATAHGLYQIYLNGHRVGDHELAPGWTSYNKRLQYQTYDVAELLKDRNAIGAMLSEGWYCGELLWNAGGKHYGERPGLLAQLEIEYADGGTECVTTNEQWRCSRGPIVSAGIYEGETYDARLEQPGWAESGFPDEGWRDVQVVDSSNHVLTAQAGPPVRKIETLTPEIVSIRPSGEVILDMGQNMVGWVRLRASGPAGQVITIRHAEVLLPDGALYTDNLREAAQTVRYTLKGDSVETYEPHFTFMGFRYIAVEGWPGAIKPGDIVGVVLHSDIERTGAFETSEPLLNKLQEAIWWGQRGNFVDVPTDCPQRNERMGWTGDAQVFAPTAAFNGGVAPFFRKWLRDLAVDQLRDGNVPFVIPNVWLLVDPKRFADAPEEIQARDPFPPAGGAGWGDAAVIVPWKLYLAYGDRRFLRDQYDSMKRWVGYQRGRAGDNLIWQGDFHFGDWLDYGSSSSHRFGKTDHDLIATAFFAHSTDLLSRAAGVLGERADETAFQALFAEIKTAFRRRFVGDGAVIGEGTQTPYVLALEFNLLDPSERDAAAKRLVENVREHGHLTTGFLGTPWLLFALSENGYLEDAYRLLNRREFPSWLYPITKGATTIWERWDGIKPDGSFQDVRMNSFNHYAYGAVGDWMYKTIAGLNIDPQAPGYRHVIISPKPGGGLTQACATYNSVYGKIVSGWRIEDGWFYLDAEIPPNTTGLICMPNTAPDAVEYQDAPETWKKGVPGAAAKGRNTVFGVTSGRHGYRARILSD